MFHTGLSHGDALLFAPAEASKEVNDFNALVRQCAESQLPVLGDQILLRLFSRYGRFPVALTGSEIEYILNRLFIHAKEEVEAGGTILMETAEFKPPAHEYSNPQPELATHVVLTFRYPRTATQKQTEVALESAADRKTVSFRTVLRDLNSLIEERMGLLSMDEFCSDVTIQICFPIVSQSGITDNSTGFSVDLST